MMLCSPIKLSDLFFLFTFGIWALSVYEVSYNIIIRFDRLVKGQEISCYCSFFWFLLGFLFLFFLF